MNREKLKRIVQDLEATEKAIKDLSAHKREVYSNNKDEFEPKVLRKIIGRRKIDPESRTKDDDLLDQYESALGMTGKLAAAAAAGERTYDEAAEAAGVSRRTMARQIARAKAVPKSTDDGIDPETGEIETALDTPPSPEPEFEVGAGTHSVEQGDRQSPLRDGGAPVETSTVGPAVTTSFKGGDTFTLSPEVADRLGFQPDVVLTIADDLTIPSFLRRVRA